MSWITLLGGFAAGAMAFTALGHSYVGEKRIVVPLLALDAPVTRSPLPRFLIRLAWHFLSVLMVASAVLTWGATHLHDAPERFTLVTLGIAWTLAGLASLIGSRARHIGWPPILLAGLCALISTL